MSSALSAPTAATIPTSTAAVDERRFISDPEGDAEARVLRSLRWAKRTSRTRRT
jgi:hypothetical protein